MHTHLVSILLSASLFFVGVLSLPTKADDPSRELVDTAQQPTGVPKDPPWESSQSATLSADGRWFACTINAGADRSRMLIRDTDGRGYREVAGAREIAFAADSKSLIYSIVSAGGFEYVVRDIETWTTKRSFRGASKVTLTPDARHLVIKGASGISDPDAGGRSSGADEVLIYSLIDDRITTIGPASLHELSGDGRFIALARAEPGMMTVLDVVRVGETEARRLAEVRGDVSSLVWSDDHRSLALVLSQDTSVKETVDVLLAVDDVTAKTPLIRSIVPEKHSAWPKGAYLDSAAPQVGTAAIAIFFYCRDEAAAVPQRPRNEDVEIHRSTDEVLYDPVSGSVKEGVIGRGPQMFAWIPEDGRLVKVTDEGENSAIILRGGRTVLVPRAGSISRGGDFQPVPWDVVDPQSESRTSLGTKTITAVSPSPTGSYVAYFDTGHWWVYDTRDGSHRSLTAGVDAMFEANLAMGRGAGGPIRGIKWLEDDHGVVAHDRFDAWLLHPDGTVPRRLTQGRERGRIYRLAAIDDGRPDLPDKSYYFHVVETKTKHSGYVRVGADGAETIIAFGPWVVDRLIKSRDTDRFVFQRESYDAPPNLFAATTGGDDLHPMSEINQRKDALMQSRRELIQYRDRHGTMLQGTLIYPVNHDPSKQYPMVVSIYRILSDDHFRFRRPAPDQFDDPATHASRGYFVFQPDIVHQPGEVGASAVDCVESAVRAVLRRDLVDPNRIGLMGISLGGYETAFVLCKSRLFAAGVAASPPVDWVNNFLFLSDRLANVHSWVHWFQTVGMPVPFWEAPESYVTNSVLYEAHGIETPLLIGIGRRDPIVDCRQGESLFNLMRYLKKPAYLVAYPHGGHSFDGDFRRRVEQFFDHYLKGERPPEWIAGHDDHR